MNGKQARNAGAPALPDQLSLLRDLEAMVTAWGHAVVATRYPLPNGLSVSMSYSVGLSEDGLPEFVVFGLPAPIAQDFSNCSVDWLKSGRLRTDKAVAAFTNLPVVYKHALDERSVACLELAHLRAGRTVPTLQIVWPDPAARFPWDPGFDESLRDHQPYLFADPGSGTNAGLSDAGGDPLTATVRAGLEQARSATDSVFAKLGIGAQRQG